MTVASLLMIATAGMLAGILAGRAAARLWLMVTLASLIAAFTAGVIVLGSGAEWEWRGVFRVSGEPLHFRLDAISAFFLVLLCIIGGAGAVFGNEYWSIESHPRSTPRGRAWWSALVLSMGLVLTVSNGLHFLIAWELFALCGYFLITLDHARREAQAAGWLYLAASHIGTGFLFAFFSTLAARAGGWDLGPMRGQTSLAPLFWLALAGFGIKAGFFPLHIWLPSAHANAPSHVSAILSGVAIKMGIYGIVRFSGWLPVPPAGGWVVIGLGATSAVLGIAFAFAQNDFKRLLAYSSVEHIGVILIGVGGALLAVTHDDPLWGRLTLAGALLHVWNHGAFKSLLFFSAGSVLHATGTREMTSLGGLWRAMPWTAGFFLLGSLAVSALPPLNGFVSEWLVYLGLFDAAAGKGPAGWAALPALIMLAISGALALATFVKAGAMLFLGTHRTQTAARAHECGMGMRAPMLVLSGVCVVTGLAPGFFWPAVARAVESWRPAWVAVEAPAPLMTLGAVHAGLMILVPIAAAWLWRKAHRNSVRRSLTWDCGYAAPAARMQYTSESFAGIVSGWFRWILQPERKIRRPRGHFPAGALRLERIPETVLEKIISPASGAIMHVSTFVRRLQHGRLQFYILYLVAGLSGLGILVLLGGAQ